MVVIFVVRRYLDSDALSFQLNQKIYPLRTYSYLFALVPVSVLSEIMTGCKLLTIDSFSTHC